MNRSYDYRSLGYGVMHQTRYLELVYSHDGPALWRVYDASTRRPVGPQYVSEAELLADLDRYAAVFGCA